MERVEAERECLAEDGKPPLGWERYLEVTALLSARDGAEHEAVLGSGGVELDTWERAERYWTLTLGLDVHQGRLDRVEEYGRTCAVARRAQERAPEPEEPAKGEEPAPDTRRELPAGDPAEAAARSTDVPTFLRAGERAPAPELRAELAQVPRPPALVSGRREVTCDALPVRGGPVLPFGGPPVLLPASRSAGAPVPAPAPLDRPDETMVPASRPPGPTLPFGAAGREQGEAVAPVPTLTIEQHATLSAELSLVADAAHRAELLARFGIAGPAALSRLGNEWQARLSSDPAGAEAWKAIYARRRAELQVRRR